MPAAARFHDPVAHSHALGGFIAGAVVGIAGAFAAAVAISAVVGAVALEVGTAGLATPLIVGVAATAVEFGATAYVGAKITEFAESAGESLGGQSMGAPSGMISQGSPDVHVNSLAAARAGDTETCDAGVIAQGSEGVLVNGRPFARKGDKTSCGGAILSGSPNVIVGGGTRTVAPIQSEVPEWVRWAAIIASTVPALGQAARAIGPALAEIEATGLGRAMQTGVKALGRAMEERGGAVRPPAPFNREPMIPPKATVKTSDFNAPRPGGVDMANPSAADRAAIRELDKSGWDATKRKEILNSGDDFRLQTGKAGDQMYGFSSKGYAKSADSPYWMDEAGYRDMQARYQDPTTGEWNSPGVKNELALPCYNKADAVYQGELAHDQSLVASRINPATETVTYHAPDGTELTKFSRTMSGGGTQIAPANGSVGKITEVPGP